MLLFLTATFAITWPCFTAYAWLSPAAGSGTPWLTAVRVFLLTLGIFAPGIVALLLTWRREGAPAVRALVARLFMRDVPVRWYVFAAGYMAAIKLAAAAVHRVWLGSWPRFGDDIWLMPFATVVSTVLLGQAGEELGWRGYALPRLAGRFGFAGAGVLLGMIWAAWHLPLFFAPDADTYHQSFARYTLQVTALSVAMTWLFTHTRGTLLLSMLMHAAINNTKDIVPSIGPAAGTPFGWNGTPIGAITLVLLWIAAIYFLARMPRSMAVSPPTTGR